MKHVLIGVVVGLACAWPRVTPRVVYYADGINGKYHSDPNCAYGHMQALSRRKADAKLEPCDKCVSPRLSDKIADRNGSNGYKQTDQNVRPVFHIAPRDRIGPRRGEP